MSIETKILPIGQLLIGEQKCPSDDLLRQAKTIIYDKNKVIAAAWNRVLDKDELAIAERYFAYVDSQKE